MNNTPDQMKTDANMRKVALTALAGTSIEWYDFFLYGAAAALVFPTVSLVRPNLLLLISYPF